MKLLVLAHIPPPHHGQSYMVKLLLEGFGGDRRSQAPIGGPQEVACYHVDARFSDGMEDIGSVRTGKVFLLLRYCLETIWCRFRYNIDTLYYIPAPGKRGALYRDWVFMALCRPFFPRLVLHWHAVGLAAWLQAEGSSWRQSWSRRLLGRAWLSIVLAEAGRADADWFGAQRVAVVPNGIPDPAPDFEASIWPARLGRLQARRLALANGAAGEGGPQIFRVLFLAHCTRSKGLFDTIEGVGLANERLKNTGCKIHLTVAGAFIDAQEEAAFRQALAGRPEADVEYAGFVSGAKKADLLRNADAFCFPTYYEAEGLPVNLLEAMACGLGIVATRWRAIPEMLPENFPGFVEARAPGQIAAVLESLLGSELGLDLRAHFLAHFTVEKHLARLKAALS